MGALEESLKQDYLHTFERTTEILNPSDILESIDLIVYWYHDYPDGNNVDYLKSGDVGFFTHPETGKFLFEEGRIYALRGKNPDEEPILRDYVHEAYCSRLFLTSNVYTVPEDTLIHRANDADNFTMKLPGSPIAVDILIRLAKHACERISAYKPSKYKDYSPSSLCYSIIKEHFPYVASLYTKDKASGDVPAGLLNDLVFIRLMQAYNSLERWYSDGNPPSVNVAPTRDILITYYYRGRLIKLNLGDYRIFEWNLLNLLSGRRKEDGGFGSIIENTPTATITHQHMEFFFNITIDESRRYRRETIYS